MFSVRLRQSAFPVSQWPIAIFLAYSCAAARDSHPLPSSSAMTRMREPTIVKEQNEWCGKFTRGLLESQCRLCRRVVVQFTIILSKCPLAQRKDLRAARSVALCATHQSIARPARFSAKLHRYLQLLCLFLFGYANKIFANQNSRSCSIVAANASTSISVETQGPNRSRRSAPN